MSVEQALAAIRTSSGTEQGEYGIDLFVSHHIDEVPEDYWVNHLGTKAPSKEQVINLLILKSKWEDEEVYDFTLPNAITDYVISVSFDEDGIVDNIAMES